MARFSRLKVLNTMIDTGLVPVFYHPNLEVAREVAAACLAGGCRLAGVHQPRRPCLGGLQ